jgi:MFS family permease
MLTYAFTIFISAFLLFLVQPIIAKQILPWFGGSAAVWTTCMVFFQCVLFAGYAYADWTSRRLAARRQVMLHIILLAVSLVCLPIIAGSGWKPAGGDDPSWRILGLLTVTIGLPYFLLSTTGPIVQAWFARSYPVSTVYRLYALSNLASLLALVSYPFLIEPWITTALQAWIWSAGYALFVAVCAITALISLRQTAAVRVDAETSANSAAKTPVPGLREHLTWLLFAAMGSLMLLAVTNHITQDLASVPFLWILPLSLYLVTFILCFEGRNWYRRNYFIIPLLLSVTGLAWTLIELQLRIGIPLSLVALFIMCMFFHGELASRKLAPEHLTRFYLMMSLGGALGGLAVGLAAVKVFNANYEFGLGLVLTLLIAAAVVRRMHKIVPGMALVALAFTGYLIYMHSENTARDTLVMKRNFYGTLSVREVDAADESAKMHRLVHGVIIHGEQYQAPDRLDEPTSYYRPDSGVGRALEALDRPNRRIGVVGLGAGTLAVYGRKGDVMRFYDINPDVVAVAQSQFSFLERSKAHIEHVLGDARLMMEQEPSQSYDLLVIDAFSGDSIPVHLATSQALSVYLRHLKPDGVIAFHISNKFLKLAPVLKRITDQMGLDGILLTEPESKRDGYSTEWFLVTADATLRKNPAIAPQIVPIEEIKGLGAWTDDFNNLFQILK